MPKIAKELRALEVSKLEKPGLHIVGTVSGLGMSISKSGARSWILRTMNGAKRSDIGLGSYPDITLAKAHERARAAKDSIREGTDPIALRKSNASTVQWTFERCALTYIEMHEPSWKNAKHAQQWRNTLATYCYPVFGSMHIRDISQKESA